MTLKPGTLIGRYEVLSLLGAGGMGEVYLAADRQLRRKIALKLLPADFTTDRDRLRRFEQEACAASALNHPNIITIHEIGAAAGAHFIVGEYVEGETLRERMAREPLEVADAVDVARQVADALAAAHETGIMHRDIKPENIMIRRDRLVKVLDFGLAKLTEKGRAESRGEADAEAATRALVNTSPGLLMGTATYMSPEQARALEVDERTDIWSLGVVLYEMLAGRAPFTGATLSDTLASILKTEPAPLPGRAPAELQRIVGRSLAKDPDERYQSVKDLLLDLKSLRRELGTGGESARVTAPPATDGAVMGGAARAGAATVTNDAATAAREDAPPTADAARPGGAVTRRSLVAVSAIVVLVFAAAAAAVYFSRRARAAREISSVAVLPFVNETKEEDHEYLSDGISESLINSLSQLPGMKVIARSSSFKYRGADPDLREVARALGVEAVLTGRIAQRGDNLRISAELVKASDGTQLWGEQYNRGAADLLAVQSEISREIAERLRLRLSAGERRQLDRRGTANPLAYELLLKGRFHAHKGGTENQKKAAEYFRQAITADPAYALAHAEMSTNYSNLALNSMVDPKEGMPKAEAAARRAMELDEGLADAHLALANIKVHDWDWEAAEREFKRAIELNPNLVDARRWYASYLTVMGRGEPAVAEIVRARELDPLSLPANADVGFHLLFARRYDEAIESLRKTKELDQSYPLIYIYLGYAYAAKGLYAEAIAAHGEAIERGMVGSSTQIYLGAAYAKAGEREKARAILKRLQSSADYVSPTELATLYAALGDRERAFASLERGYAAHDLQLQFLGVDPTLDELRSDARFGDLLRRIRLPVK